MHISEALKNIKLDTAPVKGTPRNARQAILQEALEIINPDRIKNGYKPLTIPAMEARFTGGISLFDLQWHVKECHKSDNFVWTFFGRIKNVRNKSN